MKRIHSTIIFVISLLYLFGCTGSNIDKGNASLKLGDYTMAIEFYETELKKNPQSYEARLGMGKALIQKAVDMKNDTASWKRALTNLEAARTLQPDKDISPLLCEAWSVLGRIMLTVGDTVEALSSLARAIEYSPKNVEPLNLAGIIYFRLGEDEKAEALFKKAIDINKNHPSAYFNLGMIFWVRDQVVHAHKYWLEALKLEPEDDDILYWFAMAEKRLGQ